MKKILALLAALLFAVNAAVAQDCNPRVCLAMSKAGNLLFSSTNSEATGLPIGTTGQVLVVDATGIPQWSSSASVTALNWTLANNVYGKATNAAGSGTIDILKVDATDDTVLNGDTGDVIKFAIAGTTDLTLDVGKLTFASAAEKIIPGATSLTFRNNADSASNLTIADAGTLEINRSGAGLVVANTTSITLQTGQQMRLYNGASGAIKPANTQLEIESASNGGINLSGTGSVSQGLYFSNPTASYDGGVEYVHASRYLSLKAATLISMTLNGTSAMIGATSISADYTTAVGTAPSFFRFSNGNGSGYGNLRGQASTAGALFQFAKSRATDGTADTVVNSGDDIGEIDFWGADGAAFRLAGSIVAYVNGTPGSGDMPGGIDLRTTPDGSSTPVTALSLTNDQAATLVGSVSLSTAGKPLTFKAGGAAATAGTFVCNGVTGVVVNTTNASATMTLQFSPNTIAGTAPIGAPYVSAFTAATSFTVKCSVAGETSTYNWTMIKTN